MGSPLNSHSLHHAYCFPCSDSHTYLPISHAYKHGRVHTGHLLMHSYSVQPWQEYHLTGSRCQHGCGHSHVLWKHGYTDALQTCMQ